MAKRFYRNSKTDIIFDVLLYIMLTFTLLIILYPLYFILIAAISDPSMVNSGQVWLFPRGITWKGYGYVFKDQRLLMGYINTILYSTGFMTLSVTMTVLAAYPLSNRTLFGRRIFNFLVIFPMYFGGGLVPTYIIVKNLRLVNQPVLMCILGALGAFNIIIARTFFENSIPRELIESAEIDGCNQAQSFGRIVLPLSKPILAVLALYGFVGQWNSYFNAMMYLNDMKFYPLQMVLREILLQSQALQDSSKIYNISDVTSALEQQKLAETIKYCVIVVSAGPLLCVFPFFQKYFAQGVMIGAVKG